MTQTTAPFTAKAAASAPLKFVYPITPACSFDTTVSGDARNIAVVGIYNGSLLIWSTTLLQTQPTATLTFDLQIGSDTIKAGATFTLTIPTTSQLGSVVASVTIVTPTNPKGVAFQAAIATWPLVSTL